MASHRGFTLIELLIALVAAAVVVEMTVVASRALISTLAAQAAHRSHVEEEMLGERRLQELFATDILPSEALPFLGDSSSMNISVRVADDAPTARLRGRLALDSSGVLVLRVEGMADVVLRRGVTAVAFDYLHAAGLNSRWTTAFSSSSNLPTAVRVRARTRASVEDTVVFLAGVKW